MSFAKKLAFAALQHGFLTFFGKVVSATVETLVVATLGSVNVHSIRVPCLGPFSLFLT